jgi:Sulfotransferase domain.
MSMNKNAPFFIIGSERSGTTLLMVMLDAHSRLCVPEVTWYYPRFRAYLHTYGDLERPGAFRTLVSEMVFGLKTPFFGKPWNPRTIVDEILESTKAPVFSEAFRAILQRVADEEGKPRWGEKTPHNLYYVREILEDFPDARFVHLIRDGRDVAVEQLRSAFGPTNILAAAKIWKRTQRAAARWRREVPAEQWLDVRYEDLAANPEREVARVLDFLGEEHEASTLEFYRGETARRRARTRDHRPLGEPVSTAYTGIYRRYLSVWEQEVFAGVAGEELLAAGYVSDVEPLVLPAEEEALYDEWDQRIRAATLDGPQGHIVYESYNDWLADQREERRRADVWQPRKGEVFDWDAQFVSGQRAPLHWKRRFGIRRRYESEELVL